MDVRYKSNNLLTEGICRCCIVIRAGGFVRMVVLDGRDMVVASAVCCSLQVMESIKPPKETNLRFYKSIGGGEMQD